MRMNSGFYIHRILDLFIKITGIKKHKKKRHIILLIYRLKPYLIQVLVETRGIEPLTS